MATRTTIGDPRRKHSHSTRVVKNKLVVEDRECPKCFHKKAFVTDNKIQCTKCKSRIVK